MARVGSVPDQAGGTESGQNEGSAEAATEDGVFLSWAGRKAFRAAVPTPRVFVPVAEASDPTDEDPGNLVIEGDNRQAMVSLFAQYQSQVDVVVIDPPYNTGKNDFRYDDARFQDPDADQAKGDFVQAEDGGKHTKWLNQMAPTLWLIKELMAAHGVIFVHINDIELPRLLLLMEEIFDADNWLGTVVWKSATDNNPSQIAVEHEYIVCYAKDKASVPSPWKGQVSEMIASMWATFARLRDETKDLDDLRANWKAWIRLHKKELLPALALRTEVDERGPYRPDGDLANPGKIGYDYDIPHPLNGKPVKKPLMGWRFPEATMKALLDDNRIAFRKDDTFVPGLKRYLNEDEPDRLRSVITHINARIAAADIARLFPETPEVFKNPKPVAIEEYLLAFAASKDALILDCFAGSGTTGHAVMRLNKQDGGTRRFIMIEEGNPSDQYATTLTAERLRRARTVEGLPGGFLFLRLGEQIDREAFATFQRHTVIEAIRQADASGRGVGIRPIEGKWVIGANSRRQAICLGYSVDGVAVTAADLREMFLEADRLDLARPLRVYGSACEVLESDGFSFFQIPEELLANLSVGRGLRR
jgi:adenine-specific DNA-methyltransferase